MRSEHRHKGDENDAFTGWRRVMIWKPGQRKRAKQRSHRRDRRVARRQARTDEFVRKSADRRVHDAWVAVIDCWIDDCPWCR